MNEAYNNNFMTMARVRHSAVNDGAPQRTWMTGGGDAGRLLRGYPWQATTLGAIDYWPQPLRGAISMVLHSACPMFIWWGQELINIYNDATAAVLAERHPRAFGKPLEQSTTDIWPALHGIIQPVLDSGQPAFHRNLLFKLNRNDQLLDCYFDIALGPILKDDGSIGGIFGNCTETTQEAVDRQHMLAINAAKDEFISLTSHQLRTPATGVKQYIGMLLAGFAGDLTPVQKQLAEHAYESNERQLGVITDLLTTAQADAGKMVLRKEPIDMIGLIDDVIDEQASKFLDRGQRINFKHDKPTCVVPIDRDRIRMVLDNLVDNASKYTDINCDRQITVSLKRTPTNQVVISIHDQGVGIAKDDLDSIFDKFIRASNPLSTTVGGNGLGLYLARTIVELHGGDLHVTSTVGKGSTFTISLPG